jgi:23S rRNA pseudouridine1911/1915/1917 synthase
LVKRFPYHTPEAWRERLLSGAITLNGEKAEAQTPIWPGQTLAYRFAGFEEPDLPQTAKVLVRQDHLALVHKPVGIPVHKTGRIFFQTMSHWAKEHLGPDWDPLHRLDVETGGILAFAEGKSIFKTAASEARDSQWCKAYLAIVAGCLPESDAEGAGCMDGPLGEIDTDPIRSRMHVHPAGKPSQTLWWRIAASATHTLVLASPLTGRKHQIRAHFAHAGHPIVGDKMYAQGGWAYLQRLTEELSEDDLARLGAPHQLLHAVYLRLAIPGQTVEGFDWDWSPAFDAYFPRELARQWLESPRFAGLLEQIRSAGEVKARDSGPKAI